MKQAEYLYMQNLSDKELDELMKRASESQAYSYDADSWSVVANKLNNRQDGSASSGYKPWAILLGIVLTGSFFWTASDGTSTSFPTISEQASLQVEDRDHKGIFKNIFSEGVVDEPKDVEFNLTEKASTENLLMKGSKSRVRQKEITNPITESNIVIAVGETVLETPKNESTFVAHEKQSIQEENEHLDSAEIVNVTECEVEVKDAAREERNNQLQRNRFALKISISPDFSSERFSRTDATGWNYGGAIEYAFNKRWSVSAGLLNTRKYYTAKNVTYGQYTAEFTEGDCRMWDIPLNLQYAFASRRAFSFIATLGTSSYLMKQENYTYYPDAADKNRKYYAVIRNENKEWFNVLNLSIAAQVQVRPGLFLQIEPFVKTPFSGLGEGNISLTSVGTFLSIKYKLF